MDLLEWEVGECSCWASGVNCGVAGVMLGFGGTMIFIGRVGKYGAVLSPYQLVSMLLLAGKSNPSISFVLSMGGIPMVEVVPFV